MKRLGSFISILFLLTLTALLLNGCNAMEGMGKDIERGGQEIQELAD